MGMPAIPLLATTAAEALPAVAAPSILSGLPIAAGGFTGANMITSAPLGASLLSSSTPGLIAGLGSSALDYAKANPLSTANFGLGMYDRLNPSQAPLQPSAMQSAQQLIGQRQAVPVPQFNSIPQLPRKPIYIG